MDNAFKAIAEPNRRRILELVADRELTAGVISSHFDVTRPAVSQHLKVLKQAGLIKERRQGTSRLYQAHRPGLTEARLFIEGFWDDYLGRLRRAAEQIDTDESGAIAERVAVQREVVIAATPETVWDLLTDPQQMTRWMGLKASFELSPGGAYRLEVVPNQLAVGEFVKIDPPHRLAYTWGWEGDAASVVPAGSTLVVLELVPTDSSTLLRLTHRDLPTVASAGSHSRGWSHYLERLAEVAAGKAPGPDPWATDSDRLVADLRP